MLSRIARSLYSMGRRFERAVNVIRILEVNHKMNVERGVPEATAWIPLYEAFELPADDPTEEGLYEALVLDLAHPDSVNHCIAAAREEARTLRDHISEEMWEHLNRYFLTLGETSFAGICRIGRSEFNRRVETFCSAFQGLANATMIHGEEWHFLRVGKFLERAEMICRILEIKRKSIELAPGEEGRPVDVHQWQALLRSLSGYEPYRRAHDARVIPARVLEFVLRYESFPRSLAYCVALLGESLDALATANPQQAALRRAVGELLGELRSFQAADLVVHGGLEGLLRVLDTRVAALSESTENAFFRTLRLAPAQSPRAAEMQVSQ